MVLRASFAAGLCVSCCLAGAQVPEGRAITPWAVVADTAQHTFYAVAMARGSVIAVDAKSGKAENITVGQRPIALALDIAASRLYVVNAGSGDVSVVDTRTRTVIAQPKTDLHPYAIAVDTVLHRVYVSNTFSNKLTVIDGVTNTSQQLPLGSKDALLCDPARHRLYMLGYEDSALSMLDETTGEVTRVPAMLHLWSMALEPASGIVHAVAVGGDSLLSLQPDAPSQTLHIGRLPAAVAMDGSVAVTANYGDGTITIARPTGAATVRVSPHPQALAIDALHHLAYVADTHGDSVSIIDLRKARVIATRNAGKQPYAIAVDPSTGTAIVANYGDVPYTLVSSR